MAIKERWKRVAGLPTGVEHRPELLPDLLREHGVQLAYLFGSLVQGSEANAVNLAIWSSGFSVHHLRELVFKCLGTDSLGWVDLQQASAISRFEILKSGKPLYVADELFQVEYELQTINFYRDERFRRRRWAEYRQEGLAEQPTR